MLSRRAQARDWRDGRRPAGSRSGMVSTTTFSRSRRSMNSPGDRPPAGVPTGARSPRVATCTTVDELRPLVKSSRLRSVEGHDAAQLLSRRARRSRRCRGWHAVCRAIAFSSSVSRLRQPAGLERGWRCRWPAPPHGRRLRRWRSRPRQNMRSPRVSSSSTAPITLSLAISGRTSRSSRRERRRRSPSRSTRDRQERRTRDGAW